MSVRRVPPIARSLGTAVGAFVVAAVAACASPEAPIATTTVPGPSITLPPASTAPTPTAVGCPSPASLAIVVALEASSRLACFSGAALTFEGVFGCGGCGGVDTRTATPAWLAGKEFDFLNDSSSLQMGRLALHFPPALVAPAAGSILRVTGHFDDSRAGECQIAEPDPNNPDGSPVPIPETEAIQYCRERFVVDSFEVLGTGPVPVG